MWVVCRFEIPHKQAQAPSIVWFSAPPLHQLWFALNLWLAFVVSVNSLLNDINPHIERMCAVHAETCLPVFLLKYANDFRAAC